MNLKSFSQNDTINSTIQLTKPVAKLVIKDLINADGLSLELKTTQDLLNSTNLKLKTQTELVGNLQTQIYNFENIVISKDEQLFTSEKLSKDLEEALKRQKRQTTIFKIGTGVGAVATLLLLIQ
jgi:3-dehydroquinate synthetase